MLEALPGTFGVPVPDAMRIPGSPLAVAAAALTLGAALGAQSSQTLPAGFEQTPGGSSSSWPFNTLDASTWQWHYDSAEFQAGGPIRIINLSVRTRASAGLTQNFDFPSLEVWMASSPTDYTVAGNGTQPGHDPVFADNLHADRTRVRAAVPFTGNAVPAQTWMSLDLTTPFVYDPRRGEDFVIELRNCNPVGTWGQTIDGAAGQPGQNGGNRYGTNNGCQEAASTLLNNEFVPVVLIEYEPAGPALSIDPCPGVGTLSMINLTPHGPLALAYGFTTGQTVLPGGACAGAVLGLDPPMIAAAYGPGQIYADANGAFTLQLPLLSNWCGLVSVVGFDIASCTATNVVAL